MKFEGLFTALITPFKNGEIDFNAISQLIELQVAGGVDGVIPIGTTGEAPTLTSVEKIKIIEHVLKCVNGRCKVIAGTGGYCTQEAVEQTIEAKKLGVDGSLQVTPYYNKPTQEGMYRHFSTIADVGLSIILYNVPGRTGVILGTETISRLCLHPMIGTLKEAGGSIDKVSEILSACDINILSGDDSLTLPMLSVGAKGVVSVVSNYCPKAIKNMLISFEEGDLAKAKKIHYRYYQFMRDAFIETNPIPIKTVMAEAGLINEEFRLPLCPISDKNRKILMETVKKIADC